MQSWIHKSWTSWTFSLLRKLFRMWIKPESRKREFYLQFWAFHSKPRRRTGGRTGLRRPVDTCDWCRGCPTPWIFKTNRCLVLQYHSWWMTSLVIHLCVRSAFTPGMPTWCFLRSYVASFARLPRIWYGVDDISRQVFFTFKIDIVWFGVPVPKCSVYV